MHYGHTFVCEKSHRKKAALPRLRYTGAKPFIS